MMAERMCPGKPTGQRLCILIVAHGIGGRCPNSKVLQATPDKLTAMKVEG
jgi:hypothetical protein